MKTRSLQTRGRDFYDRRLDGKHLFRIPNCYQCPVRQKFVSCRVKSATLSARRDA